MKRLILTGLNLLIFTLSAQSSLLAGVANPQPSTDFVIRADNVGGITPASTKQDLIKLFGAKNVEAYEVPAGEGETVPGARVYGNSKNELLIEWKKNGTPESITVQKSGTDWKTPDGITIGTSLSEVRRLNGAAFELTGFGWDYAGMVVSWGKGKLPSELSLSFKEVPFSPAESSQVVGDKTLSSDHPTIQKKAADLEVKAIQIYWTKKTAAAAKTCPPSQVAAIPKIKGLSYHEARKALLTAGWKPEPTKPLTQSISQDPDLSSGNGFFFWKKGYTEVESCAGTGMAACAFLFKDQYDNRLRVVTAGEEHPEKGFLAQVDNFKIICEP